MSVDVEKLEAQFGRVKHVVYNGVDLVFRKPKRTECKHHSMKLDDPQQKADADEQLAQLLIVQCGETKDVAAREMFLELLEEYPYLVKSAPVGNALAQLTGVVQDDSVKSFGSSSKPSVTPHQATQKG